MWKKLFQPRQPPPTQPPVRLGDLRGVHDFWRCEEGIHHPDWQKIAKLIGQRTTTTDEREAAWHHAALQWLDRLKDEIGAGCRLGESCHFLLVSAKSTASVRYFLGQCEAALLHLRARLGEAAWRWPHGKHAVVMFEDEDTYYRYISHFHADGGAYGTSSGMCLRRNGYCHTVLAPTKDALPVLVHELTHLCLTTRRLPLWLEEGLATSFERDLTGGGPSINKESIARQRIYWDRDSIQRFWTGESFRVGDERELSYGLAEHLVTLLAREFRVLGPFILAADREDAGQAAARLHLGLDLSDVAAAFLGEGDWQPRPVERPEDGAGQSPP